jgi:hypothetical protein
MLKQIKQGDKMKIEKLDASNIKDVQKDLIVRRFEINILNFLQV